MFRLKTSQILEVVLKEIYKNVSGSSQICQFALDTVAPFKAKARLCENKMFQLFQFMKVQRQEGNNRNVLKTAVDTCTVSYWLFWGK